MEPNTRPAVSPSVVGRLLGDERTFPLEHRLSSALMLVVAVNCALAGLLNLAAEATTFAQAGVSATANRVLGVTGFVYVGLYYWSRHRRSFEASAWTSLLILLLIFYPAIWLGNYGVAGGMAMVGLGMTVAAASVFSGWRRNLTLMITMAVTLVLFLVDYHQLVPIAQYQTRAARYVDVFSTLAQIGVAIVATVIMMRTSYQRERDKVNDYAALVDRTNRELETALAQNQLLARTDALTQLPNRRQLEEVLAQRIVEATRYGRVFSVAVFDVDHFKAVNDTHGHATGDQILEGLGLLVRGLLRGADMCARWGGEEFTVLCPETSLEGIRDVAERLRVAVQDHAFAKRVPITISLGVATWRSGDTQQSLFERADAALYAAKRGGRNRVAGAEASLRPQSIATRAE